MTYPDENGADAAAAAAADDDDVDNGCFEAHLYQTPVRVIILCVKTAHEYQISRPVK